ncbi:hypothetical protein IFT62_01330 [Pseudomonas lutea]|uniref:Uncharacterized protein n=1 Tax=Pseudomonas lutea TaxID=243924 RepID=A0ABR9A1B7_9PSED|nr:hypothetical protein [Pseudomonas lutea]MBD8119847.1 hypothetical protein [Pseudomonas lutea]
MSARTGALVGSNLVSLYEGVNRQDRENIMECLLGAHMFASRHFDQRRDYSNWFFRYRTRLQSRGCVFVSPIIHQPRVISSAAELDSSTFRVVRAVGSRILAELVQASWKGMRANEYANQFFKHGDADGVIGNVQVVPCTVEATGDINMLICSISLTGTVDIKDYDFWTETRREMLLRISGGLYRFDRTVYAAYRAQIRSELGKDFERAIRQFPI